MWPIKKEPLLFVKGEGDSIFIRDSKKNHVGYIYWSPENMNFALTLSSGVLYFDELQQVLAEMERLTEEWQAKHCNFDE